MYYRKNDDFNLPTKDYGLRFADCWLDSLKIWNNRWLQTSLLTAEMKSRTSDFELLTADLNLLTADFKW